jgi:RND family efflux transporter MFP subunit
MTEIGVSAGVKKVKRWPLLAAAGAVILIAWGLRKYQEARLYREVRRQEEQASRETVQVKAYRARALDMSGTLRRIGTIRARAETNLQFGAQGRVVKFDLEKGQFVKRGALIASLDPQEAKNNLVAAEVEYQKAADKYFKDRIIDRLEFERAKARYNQARLEVDKTLIRAPHEGYLVEKWVNAGEQVDGGTVVGKLMDKSGVFVDMDLSEDDIQHLKAGQKVEVTVDAVPDFKAQGEVVSITPYLKGDSRSFNVKVSLPQNPKESLNPGMFARCSIHRYEKSGAMAVPIEASAELREKQMKVFVVDNNNQAHARTLTVVFMGEGQVEVSGLSEGELVILNPATNLQEGAKVQVLGAFDPASAAPSGG